MDRLPPSSSDAKCTVAPHGGSPRGIRNSSLPGLVHPGSLLEFWLAQNSPLPCAVKIPSLYSALEAMFESNCRLQLVLRKELLSAATGLLTLIPRSLGRKTPCLTAILALAVVGILLWILCSFLQVFGTSGAQVGLILAVWSYILAWLGACALSSMPGSRLVPVLCFATGLSVGFHLSLPRGLPLHFSGIPALSLLQKHPSGHDLIRGEIPTLTEWRH